MHEILYKKVSPILQKEGKMYQTYIQYLTFYYVSISLIFFAVFNTLSIDGYGAGG